MSASGGPTSEGQKARMEPTRKQTIAIFLTLALIHLTIHLTLRNSNLVLLRAGESDEDGSASPAGRIDYSAIYRSTPDGLKPFLISLLIVWLSFLFSFVGIVASDFFCPNLSTISSRLGLSESLAGVTFLGFGNGAPDVFSTFAAMKAGTGSLAIGELIGAASFIVSVVVGSMSIITPFKVPRHSFLRDLGFFTLAIAFILLIIRDGKIVRWEANCLVALYLLYVLTVALGSWYYQRKHSRRELIRKVRSEFAQNSTPTYSDDPDFPVQPVPESEPLISNLNSSPSHPSSPLLQSDSVDLPFPQHHHRTNTSFSSFSHNQSFKTLLESNDIHSRVFNMSAVPMRNRRMRAPSLSYRAQQGPFLGSTSLNHPLSHLGNDPSSGPSSSVSSLAEDSPVPLRRRNRSIVARNSIRPSLLGAIEFRDVVNSLASESGDPLLGAPHREQSQAHARRRSGSLNAVFNDIPGTSSVQSSPAHPTLKTRLSDRSSRGRWHSQSAISPPSPPPWELDSFTQQQSDRASRGRLSGMGDRILEEDTSGQGDSSWKTSVKRDSGVRTAEDGNTWGGELPAPISPTYIDVNRSTPPEIPSIMITAETGDAYSLPTNETEWDRTKREEQDRKRRERRRKLIKLIWNVLLPTLKGWRQKSHLGRFLALMSSPAILVLTLTLPVVDDESEEYDDTDLVESAEDERTYNDDDAERGEETESCHTEVDGRLDRIKGNDELRMGQLRRSDREDMVEEFQLPRIAVMDEFEDEEEDYSDGTIARWLAVVQCVLAPPFCVLGLVDLDEKKPIEFGFNSMKVEGPRSIIYLVMGTIIGLGLGKIASTELKKAGSALKIGLCFLGFIVSMVWILNIVNEVVGILKCLGEIFGLSDAILGLTVFGIGNSLGDFVANVTIARMGFPVMAISACFGGPMLNILMGVGLSSSYLIGEGVEKVTRITSSKTLMVSTVGLLTVLGSMMIIVPLRGYLFDRKLGIVLMVEYLIVFVINILVEIHQQNIG